VRASLISLALLVSACTSSSPGGQGTKTEAKKEAPQPEPDESPIPPTIAPDSAEDEHAANVAAARKRSPIKPDEEVLLFPTVGRFDKDANVWRIPIRGWIYEPEEEDVLRTRLTNGLADAVGYGRKIEGEIFESRIKPFIYDNESGKEVPIDTGGSVAISRSSGKNGHFDASAVLAAGPALKLAEQRQGRSPPPMLPIAAITRADDDRRFRTRAFLMPERGLTLISDIDDTVKISEVTDKTKLLANTFLEPFRPVPGMAQAYGAWLRDADGSHLHFVSSSPWQLYPALKEMLDAASFPPATFALKQIRLKDTSIADLLADPQDTKGRALRAVVNEFPQRRIALVGDSGEKDPEVYGDLAREFPDRVVYIAIRNVTDEGKDAPRYAHAFRDLEVKWEVFTDPTQLTGPP
jgi:hypothetical protein